MIQIIDQNNTVEVAQDGSSTEVNVSKISLSVQTVGVQGPTGAGVPDGGTTQQGLVKLSDDDYDTAWEDITNSVNGKTGDVTLDKTDVGLDNVDNTSDADKPISDATQSALDDKLDKNTAVTGATKTKITYDSKGLVTAGSDAAISDISGLQTSLDSKLDKNSAITGATKTKITYDSDGLVTAGTDASIADISGLSTALDGKVDENAPISGATKTKITYDSKGLVTAGADIVIADISGLQTDLDNKVDKNIAITGATKTKVTYDAKGLVTSGADAGISDISGLQTALNNKLETSLKGANSGLAELDSGGKVPSAQLPAIAITDVYTVNSQAAQLALTAQEGDVAIRTDLNKSYVHNGGTSGTMADWSELLTPTDAVLSVNGMTGAVTVDKSSVGLGNVDNVQQLPASYLDTDNTLAANSDVKVASQKAVKSYVDTGLSGKQNTLAYTPEDVANKDTDTALTANSDTKYSSQKAVKSYIDTGLSGKQNSLGYTAEDVANKDTDNTLAANSDTKYPSQKAIKAYVDTGLSAKQNSLGYTPEDVANKDTDNTLAANSDTKYPSQKAIKAYVDTGLSGKQNSLGFTPENVSNKDTDNTLAANSDTKYPSQKAIKSYVDTGLSGKEPSITVGTTGQYWRGDKSFQTLNATAVGLGSVTNDAQVPKSAFTAKGDLLAGTGAGAYTAVTVGTDGKALVADSASTGGVKWTTISSGKTYYKYVVAASGGDYTTLQDALTAAVDGDTIFVRSGTYALAANTSSALNNITIIGENPKSTIIDCTTYTLTFTGSYVTIQNMGFTTGSATRNLRTTGTYARFINNIVSSSVRFCMLNVNGNNSTVQHCSFINSSTTNNSSAMVEVSTARSVIENCYIEAPFYGTGAMLDGSNTTLANGNVIYSASADSNNTYAIRGFTNVTNNVIILPNNQSILQGTGIQVYGSGVVTGNSITGSLTYGLYQTTGSYATISNNTMDIRNTSTTAQYGIYISGNSALGRCSITGNTIYGGNSNSYGIYLASNFVASTITANYVDFAGYALYMSASANSIVTGNFLQGSGANSKVYISGTTRCLMSNNFMSDYTTTTDAYPESNSATHAISNNMVNGFDGGFDGNAANSKKSIWLKNTSGATIAANSVVILKSAANGNEMTTTTTGGDNKVIGVNVASSTNNNFSQVVVAGKTNVLADATTAIAIGDWLTCFTTAGYVKKAAAGDTIIGMALAALASGTGTISMLVVQPRLI